MVRNLSPGYLLALLISDVLIVTVGLLASWWLRLNLSFGAFIPDDAVSPPLWLFVVTAMIWIVGLWQANLYSPQIGLYLYLRRIVTGHSIAALLFLGMIYIVYRDYSRLQALYLIAIVFVLLLIHRGVLRYFSDPVSEKRRVLIVGTDRHAATVGQKVSDHAWANLTLVGHLRPNGSHEDDDALPIRGGLDDLAAVVQRERVNEVIVCVRWFDDVVYEEVARIVRRLQDRAVNIRLAPDYTDLAYFHLSTEDFDGLPLIAVREAILSPFQRIAKRVFDLVVALVVLALTWPLLLLIALLIKWDSPGPAIFRQMRIGQYGKPFAMLKFRTMAFTTPPDELRGRYLKNPDNPHVTRVGRFLRKTSLDELPQFINVLRGEMSVVGPRPELPEFVEKYEWWQRKRFELPQGVTGWWQINGRAERPMFENTEDDLFYISHYSLWLDFQIVLRTVVVVLSRRGAY
ncbi:MAG: sugar transferase [Anaerolineae bacterium]|nr:sugar transferase [Anaerolineae bacterium]